MESSLFSQKRLAEDRGRCSNLLRTKPARVLYTKLCINYSLPEPKIIIEIDYSQIIRAFQDLRYIGEIETKVVEN